MTKKLYAEFIGTFWLVLGGCGAAVLATGNLDVGIGWLGVSLAFGLTVLTMAYAVGGISGGHFNPAVSLGLMLSGKLERSDLLPYWAAQVLGAITASFILWIIANGAEGFSSKGNFALNGYGSASPGGYGFFAALVTEIVMTAMFLLIILGATSKIANPAFAPIAIGLGLTLIHLISIPVTNTSVNPAALDRRGALWRRTGPPATLAVLGRAADRCRPRRLPVENAGARSARRRQLTQKQGRARCHSGRVSLIICSANIPAGGTIRRIVPRHRIGSSSAFPNVQSFTTSAPQ